MIDFPRRKYDFSRVEEWMYSSLREQKRRTDELRLDVRVEDVTQLAGIGKHLQAVREKNVDLKVERDKYLNEAGGIQSWELGLLSLMITTRQVLIVLNCAA